MFLDSFGLKPEGLNFADASVNVSLDMTELKIMLALNKLKPRMVFSDLLVENAARKGRKASDLSHQLLSRDSLDRIERYFADDNARFARAYFGRDMLFEPRNPAAEAQQSPDAEPGLSEVMEVFGGLLVRFDERLAALERRVRNAPAETSEASNALAGAARAVTARAEWEEAGGAVG